MNTAAANQTGDQYYLAQPVPYRSAKRQFLHVSELRLLKGVSSDVYAQLAPYVSALPAPSTINLNTASVPVLMTLVTQGSSTSVPMTQQSAQALWQQGHAHFQRLADLASMVPGLQPDCGAYNAEVCYGFGSSYFLARGEITLDGLPLVFYSMIERNKTGAGGGIRVIQRSRGADG